MVGGADVVRQCLDLGVVDELRLHVVPVVLGGGTPLFGTSPRLELECTSAVSTPFATHLTYRRAQKPAGLGSRAAPEDVHLGTHLAQIPRAAGVDRQQVDAAV